MALVIYIKNLFVRLLSFLFGKTWIFITVLAWFLIITGILFLFRPERARKKLMRMSFRPVRWILLLACLYVAGILIPLSHRLSGILAVILLVVIIIAALRFYLLLKKNLFNKFILWFSKIPIKQLKVFALIQVAIGIFILALKKRIWF